MCKQETHKAVTKQNQIMHKLRSVTCTKITICIEIFQYQNADNADNIIKLESQVNLISRELHTITLAKVCGKSFRQRLFTTARKSNINYKQGLLTLMYKIPRLLSNIKHYK